MAEKTTKRSAENAKRAVVAAAKQPTGQSNLLHAINRFVARSNLFVCLFVVTPPLPRDGDTA